VRRSSEPATTMTRSFTINGPTSGFRALTISS
jgi:hypothetical protein